LNEIMPFIDPGERFLLFASNRAGTLGLHDSFISHHNAEGSWSQPMNLGAGANSSDEDGWPRLTPDGRYSLFTHNNAHGANPYWIDARVMRSLRRGGHGYL
jgi:hypothetical protein